MLCPVRVATSRNILQLAHSPLCVCLTSLPLTGGCKEIESSYLPSPQWSFLHSFSLAIRAEIRTNGLEKSEFRKTIAAMDSNTGDGGFTDSSLLEIIDELLKLNVRDYVALPLAGPPNPVVDHLS